MRTNHPKAFFNFFPSMNLFSQIPINIPIIESPVKMSKNGQSISKFCTSPKNPISDLIAIMNKEVATAFFIGNFANNTKAGIIKKPPPVAKMSHS